MPSTPVAERFGRRIAAERQRRGWSVTDLAEKSGVTRNVIRDLERGIRGCRLDSAVLAAAPLEISLDGLTGPCGRCGDEPEPGYDCRACGAHGDEPQRGGGSDA